MAKWTGSEHIEIGARNALAKFTKDTPDSLTAAVYSEILPLAMELYATGYEDGVRQAAQRLKRRVENA